MSAVFASAVTLYHNIYWVEEATPEERNHYSTANAGSKFYVRSFYRNHLTEHLWKGCFDR